MASSVELKISFNSELKISSNELKINLIHLLKISFNSIKDIFDSFEVTLHVHFVLHIANIFK